MSGEKKVCVDCGQELPITEFYRYNIGDKSYLAKRCKDCTKKHKEDWQNKRKSSAKSVLAVQERIQEVRQAQEGIRIVFTPELLKATKTCRICKRRVLLKDFPKDVNLALYHNAICNECRERGFSPDKNYDY